ncbi:hypothetical protein ACWC9U_27265 [Streptomyces sp. 900116325]
MSADDSMWLIGPSVADSFARPGHEANGALWSLPPGRGNQQQVPSP